ncbi:MAG TPA: hypothetical protein PLR83_02630 [Pyrinomonadaceae bacterium]|nr:hypothetical protein [Pyrinomonadaceae bacterium]
MEGRLRKVTCQQFLLILFAIAFLTLASIPISVRGYTLPYFNTKTITDGGDFAFPIFSHENNGRTSTRINRFLQLSELYYVGKHRISADIFHQAKANDGSIYGVKFAMSPSIYSNNSRVLSLGFSESSSGATTHYWVQYYTFNSGNGDRIDLKDLFYTRRLPNI